MIEQGREREAELQLRIACLHRLEHIPRHRERVHSAIAHQPVRQVGRHFRGEIAGAEIADVETGVIGMGLEIAAHERHQRAERPGAAALVDGIHDAPDLQPFRAVVEVDGLLAECLANLGFARDLGLELGLCHERALEQPEALRLLAFAGRKQIRREGMARELGEIRLLEVGAVELKGRATRRGRDLAGFRDLGRRFGEGRVFRLQLLVQLRGPAARLGRSPGIAGRQGFRFQHEIEAVDLAHLAVDALELPVAAVPLRYIGRGLRLLRGAEGQVGEDLVRRAEELECPLMLAGPRRVLGHGDECTRIAQHRAADLQHPARGQVLWLRQWRTCASRCFVGHVRHEKLTLDHFEQAVRGRDVALFRQLRHHVHGIVQQVEVVPWRLGHLEQLLDKRGNPGRGRDPGEHEIGQDVLPLPARRRGGRRRRSRRRLALDQGRDRQGARSKAPVRRAPS